MKKYVSLIALWSMVTIGFIAVSHAAQNCVRSDMWCYESGPSQNLTTVGRLDASGNLTLNGNSTVTGSITQNGTGVNTLTGPVVYPSVFSSGITSMTIISPTANFILLASTGGLVTIGGTVAAVSTATAVNGQYLILGSTVPSDSNGTVSIASGTASAMDLSAATRKIGSGSVLTLIFNSIRAQWSEISYAAN